MNFKYYNLLVIIWIASLFIFFGVAYQYGIFTAIPNSENLVRWDALWYKSVITKGYQYVDLKSCNAGFFPLFPMLWQAIGIESGLSVSLVNCLIYITGLWFLIKTFRPSFYETLLLVSLPSMLFFYLPYTEALFFLFSSFMLIGLKKQHNYMLATAIFLASLTRPSFLFFIPAFGALYIVDYKKDIKWALAKKYLFLYILPSILALVIIVIAQKIATDTWFAYFKAQSNAWSRKFRFPRLPFGSLEDKSFYWMEVISFWIGTFITIMAGFISYQYYKAKESVKRYSRVYLFSICYLVMSFLSIVFFNPTWEIGRTLLHGINRYMFANPFFFIFVWKSSQYFKFKKIHFVYLFLFSLVFWLLLEPLSSYIEHLPYYLVITAYLLSFSFFIQTKNKVVTLSLFLVNIIGQVYLFHKFINAEWIG